jgi:hypothetical protein
VAFRLDAWRIQLTQALTRCFLPAKLSERAPHAAIIRTGIANNSETTNPAKSVTKAMAITDCL